MRNLLLVTLYGEHNFGNRLQCYALNSILEEMNYKVDDLVVKNLAQKSIKRSMVKRIKTILSYIGVEKYKLSASREARIYKFIDFREIYFPHIINVARDEIEQRDWSEYDFAITGSDQVWHNWGTTERELELFYLSFIEKSKRVPYAPSFGFTQFPREDIEVHRRGLVGMRTLSCREQEGCELIRELTGLEAQRVLDPTLLLTKEQWVRIEKKPDFSTRRRYLLTFFLDNITTEYQREIDRIKAEKNLVEININNPYDIRHYAISPDEFIWLIHHAEVVCTDSFHCSVFSIIFCRGLRVFKRAGKYTDMFGRLHDLLELFGLMDLAYGYGDGSIYSSELTKEANERYQIEREKSLAYLKNTLDCKG